MEPHSLDGRFSEPDSQVLWKDDERVFRRGWRFDGEGTRRAALLVVPAAEHPSRSTLDAFRHEYELKDELDGAWAVRPLELAREAGRVMLVLEDPGGESLGGLVTPIEPGPFLRLAIGIAVALGKLHQRGLVHKDIKPANLLANGSTGEVRLTGFGMASRLAREHQSPRSPETLAGTLAYMAPEQTGRMNRSVDSRSDLYSLGVTLYQLLTGALPFAAVEPMEWVHCHLARLPVPPAERLPEIPSVISAIVMKLLAKRAEDRYQTAAGIERDLRRCLGQWDTQRRIDEFPLGEHDTPDRLRIPEKLYGRENEVEILLGAFDHVVRGGGPQLVLVSGYSGIGKSSVVNELQPVLVPPRGLFASGKFDQYKRDIPYATLAQAFQSLIRQLLTKSEAELSRWRHDLRDALDQNGRLIVDVVPELKLIIGDQPALPDVSAPDAQRRFQLAFRQFIGVFARAEHPLALFLDDLQWLDAATLELLADLLTRSELQHLLVIGAYRDNEVDASHPLTRKLEAIRSEGGEITQITLGPLSQAHLEQLLADTLRSNPERSAPLARLVREKTGGNPFFTIQFIHSLAEEEMLTIDRDAACWSWDLHRVRARAYTDNVVDLMLLKLVRLPSRTQSALQQLACLGSTADTTTLSLILEESPEQVQTDLWESTRLGFIEGVDGSYRFIHDRVHEAAYSLIPEGSRAEAHLRIGRLLAAHTSSQKLEEKIFDIVNHLNRGATLITSRAERENLSEMNLIAGKRAKASTAYASALKYFNQGAELLGDEGWERRRDLMLPMELERAECEFLTGALEAADRRLTALASRTTTTMERASLASLHMNVCTELMQPARAVTVALDYLRHVGIECSPHPTETEVRRQYERVWLRLGGRAIEELKDLPRMTDPESAATVDLLTKILVAALLTDRNLDCLTSCWAVELSLERGNCAASCLAYISLSRAALWHFRDYQTAFRFAQVGLELVESDAFQRLQGAVYINFGALIAPWMKHVRTATDLARRAFEAANKIGDLRYANYANIALGSDLLFSGDSLSDVLRDAERALAFAQKTRFSGDIDLVIPQLALILTLRGLTPTFGCFDCELIQELQFERYLGDNPNLAIHECWYWIRKMQARFLASDYTGALAASSKAQELLWVSTAYIEEAEYHFYSALSRAAFCDSIAVDEHAGHLGALAAHERQLEIWSEICPENFESRATLVGAEIARIETRDLDAMRLYERAIRSSRTNGFVHNEALAYERASAFYRARGFDQFADSYLRNARACYAAWGADGKVRQLDRMYPRLKQDEASPGSASTIAAPVEGLDLAAVIRVSQAFAGEMVLEKLLDIVMRKAMEHAGAERGALIVPQGNEPKVEAEAETSGNDVIVRLRAAFCDPGPSFPGSIVRYVMRTHDSLILDDAISDSSFSTDPHIRAHRVRSVLCLPLLNQGKLTGILYLENNLAARVFTPDRLALLKVLAVQAAISLENTRLYSDLEDREAKIRRLVDANILGVFIWNLDGAIVEANEAFLHMLQHGRDDLLSGRLRWRDLTPVEWRERDQCALETVQMIGTVQPYEKEFLRKDGSRVSVLIGAALFEETGNEGVAFVLDLTERKRVEQSLRQLESDLAHMNRLSTLGELTASLAHEVKQPIATARNNARAALNFMDLRPPDWNEVREAVSCIVGDADRAGAIIDRISDQIKKAPPRKQRCDVNAAINEVIGLARSVTTSNGISVQTRLADELGPVLVDRVQLQQVVLNLILNAVEAMGSADSGPRDLIISTAQDRTGVLVAVRDSGPGINPADLERIFRSFYTTKAGGTGMGLSVCRSIIDAHGGHLWAGVNEPRGAVFQFTLPGADQGS